MSIQHMTHSGVSDTCLRLPEKQGRADRPGDGCCRHGTAHLVVPVDSTHLTNEGIWCSHHSVACSSARHALHRSVLSAEGFTSGSAYSVSYVGMPFNMFGGLHHKWTRNETFSNSEVAFKVPSIPVCLFLLLRCCLCWGRRVV